MADIQFDPRYFRGGANLKELRVFCAGCGMEQGKLAASLAQTYRPRMAVLPNHEIILTEWHIKHVEFPDCDNIPTVDLFEGLTNLSVCMKQKEEELQRLDAEVDKLKTARARDCIDYHGFRLQHEEKITEISAELEAQRARFSTTVCGLREDLQLAFQIHADVENQTTEALERVVQDRNRLGIEWEQARDMLRQELDAAKKDLRQETGSRSYWQAEAGGLKRSLEASRQEGREVATAYFRLRRLCYLTAFLAPLAGAAALAATLYRYTLLPWLTTHAPSSGTWCLLAVGLACLLVGRRWRGAVVERELIRPAAQIRPSGTYAPKDAPTDPPPGAHAELPGCPADPLRDKLAARIEGLTDEECSPPHSALHRLAPPREIPEQALPAKECAHGPDWPFCNRCGWHSHRPTMTPVHRCRCGEPAIKWDRHISGTGWMPWCGTSGCCC